MKHSLLILTCIVALKAFSQSFDSNSFSDGYNTIQYRICDTSKSTEAPRMVIYLHGGTVTGDDNVANLNSLLETDIFNYISRQSDRYIVFVPQCPTDRIWSEKVAHPMSETLKSAIDYIADTYEIDTNHIHITGGSAGGTGLWRMLSDYPGFFAAAIIAAGNPSGLNYDNIIKTPVYCVISKSDNVIKFNTVFPVISEMKKMEGADITLKILETETHAETCKTAYTDYALTKMLGYSTSYLNTISQNSDIECYYDILGVKHKSPIRGINIVKYTDGHTDKVLVK
ncbi:MAG: prolyl oligopeptidase family serine peptidase [Muribaculaceae bacterium]